MGISWNSRKENAKFLEQKGITPCSSTDWGMLGIQLGRKRQGTPGDSIKTVDSDSLILGSPLLKENLNRNLNRNSLLFYVL